MIRSLFLATGAFVWIAAAAVGGWFAIAGAVHVASQGRRR